MNSDIQQALQHSFDRFTHRPEWLVLATVIGDYLDQHPATDKIGNLFPGSWIQHNFGIWIGHPEAAAILMKLQGADTPRPMTHDLMATIFDELEMPVLVEIADRMREAKAAPVIGAMRPERARLLTTELARHRAARSRQPGAEAPAAERAAPDRPPG